MNISEISKPSVERTIVNKLLNRQGTDPVTESKKISDSVHLSRESKKRLKEKAKADASQEQQDSDQTSSDLSLEDTETFATNFGAEKFDVPKTTSRFSEPKGLTIDIKV